MADVYSRNVNFGGAFSADRAVLTFSRFGVGSLVSQINLRYAQQITKLFDLTENSFYYMGGRTNGSQNIGRILGPRKIAAAFYTDFGDVCKSGSNSLQFALKSTVCTADQPNSTYQTHYNVIVDMGVQANAQDMVVNETLALMFSSLDYA